MEDDLVPAHHEAFKKELDWGMAPSGHLDHARWLPKITTTMPSAAAGLVRLRPTDFDILFGPVAPSRDTFNSAVLGGSAAASAEYHDSSSEACLDSFEWCLERELKK